MLFEGIDLFKQQVPQVIEQLQQRGYVLNNSEPGFPRFDGIAMGFNAEFIDDEDDDDEEAEAAPHYFASVLLAPPGYYSAAGL